MPRLFLETLQKASCSKLSAIPQARCACLRGPRRRIHKSTTLDPNPTPSSPSSTPPQPQLTPLSLSLSLSLSSLSLLSPLSPIHLDHPALIARWIEMGAPWGSTTAAAVKPASRKFWASCLRPIRRSLRQGQELDSFSGRCVSARRPRKQGPEPAKTADKRTLIRRATYDLIGLPPTPAEIQGFLSGFLAGCLRQSSRSSPGFASIRRALGTPLARRGSLCRFEWTGREPRLQERLSGTAIT